MEAAEVKGDKDGGQAAGLTNVKDIGAREVQGSWSAAGELGGRNPSSEDGKGGVGFVGKETAEESLRRARKQTNKGST